LIYSTGYIVIQIAAYVCDNAYGHELIYWDCCFIYFCRMQLHEITAFIAERKSFKWSDSIW